MYVPGPFCQCTELFLDGETREEGHLHERVRLTEDSHWLTVLYENGDVYNYALSKIVWMCRWQYAEEQGGE